MDERKAKLIDVDLRRQLGGNRSIFFWRVRTCRYLGYARRRTSVDGYWYARIKLQQGGSKSKSIALADDTMPADGVKVLTFYQALSQAERWFAEHREIAAPDHYKVRSRAPFDDELSAPNYTVGKAVADYMKWHRYRKPKSTSAYYQFRNHVLDQLGHIPLGQLTMKEISDWLHELSEKPKIISSSRTKGLKYGEPSFDHEWIRRRKNSANRIFSLLRAALNLAYERGHIDTNKAWKPVKPFKDVNRSRTPKGLSRPEILRLIGACSDQIVDIVKVGLVSGCRIGDILDLRVEDYQPKFGRLQFRASKTQNLVRVALSNEGIDLFNNLVAGRTGQEHLFTDADGRPWDYRRLLTQFLKCQRTAGIDPTVTFTQLRHTFACNAIMAGIPMKVIATQLGHVNSRMVEHYYGHLTNDLLTEEVRKKMPSLYT